MAYKSIATSIVLFRWPALVTPRTVNRDDPPEKAKFSITGITTGRPEMAERENAFLSALWTEMDQCAKDNAGKSLQELVALDRKLCALRQNKSDPKKADKPGFKDYPDGWHFAASTKFKPTVYDAAKRELQRDEDIAAIYDGCYGIMSVTPYAWHHPTGGKGVSLNVDWVQVVWNHTPRLAGGGAEVPDVAQEAMSPPSFLPQPDAGSGDAAPPAPPAQGQPGQPPAAPPAPPASPAQGPQEQQGQPQGNPFAGNFA